LWFFKWIRSWKNVRRFLFVLVCLITFILLGYAEEDWRGKRAWAKHRRQWEAEGEKFSVAELIPAPVPDDKNFALMPLLKPALEIMRQSAAASRDTNALARLERTSAELSGGPGKRDHLELGSVEKGTFAELTSWAEFYRGNTNYPQAGPNASPAEVVLVALGRTDPEMKQLREAGVARPYCRFPIGYTNEPSWAILLPHLSHIKRLAILAHVHAVAELETGRVPEAFEDLKLAFRLSDCVHDEPFAIDHLVRISTLNIALQVVREGIFRHGWTDGQLAEIQTYLGSLDLLAEYKQVMRGERGFTIEGVDYLRRNGVRNVDQYLLSNSDRSYLGNPMPAGWFYQNMLMISRIHQNLIFPSVNEQAHRVFPDIADQEEKAVARLRAAPYTILARLLLPGLQKVVVKSARAQANVDAARVACALERYRLSRGDLPAPLHALTPAYLDHIPVDVIDGQPLRYRPQSNGNYVLYSVGWNRTDDGGQIAWPSQEESKNRIDETRGDWVWANFPLKHESAL
jgi:hypothetical protein